MNNILLGIAIGCMIMLLVFCCMSALILTGVVVPSHSGWIYSTIDTLVNFMKGILI